MGRAVGAVDRAVADHPGVARGGDPADGEQPPGEDFGVAAGRRATSVETEDGKVMVKRNSDLLMPGGRIPRLKNAGADARLEEILVILERARDRDFCGPRA